MSKQQRIDKRVEAIRRSLGVDGTTYQFKPIESGSSPIIANKSKKVGIAPILEDSTFLRKDMLKIVVISLVAFGAQFLLYYLTAHHIVNLPFIK